MNKKNRIKALKKKYKIRKDLFDKYCRKESPHKLTNDSRLMGAFITMIEEGEKQCSTTK